MPYKEFVAALTVSFYRTKGINCELSNVVADYANLKHVTHPEACLGQDLKLEVVHRHRITPHN